MNKFWEKVEHYNAKLITPAVVGLLFVIVVELGFHDFAEHYHTLIAILDGFIVAIFVIDLIFLAIRAKSTAYFFKHYWLDIVAIFPFVLAMTILSKIYQIFSAAGKFAVGQAIVHESLEARKGVRALARAGRFTRWLRIGARMIRVITKSRFFSHVQAKRHLAKRNHHLAKRNQKKKVVKKKVTRKKR